MFTPDQPRVKHCAFRGPWIISRETFMGQTCWHPDNLKEGRTHLFSKSCAEWGDDCPLLRGRKFASAHTGS
jgi:hypothetical protein